MIALINDLKSFAPGAFQNETMTRIADAWLVVDGEPMQDVPAPAEHELVVAGAAAAEPSTLPITKSGALKASHWLLDNYAADLRTAIAGKPYQVKHLCGIVCQESAYKWLNWIGKQSPATIIARCVFDASGDYPGSPRSAFPKNTAAFRQRFGGAFTD